MKRFIILLLLIVTVMMSSCSGCSKSGRRAQFVNNQNVIDQNKKENPTYFIVSSIYKGEYTYNENIVTYIADISVNLTISSHYDRVKFYDYSGAFKVGDTIHFKHYEKNKKAEE